MTAAFSPSHVDLAHEAAFRLGEVEVHPSLSEVAWRGERQSLQPKVMQVLVALARARGGVVSRDALVEACWDGRAVGDDAINRCIAQARRLATWTGAFAVETIPRVGHRLTVGHLRVERSWRRLGFFLAGAGTLMLVIWWSLGQLKPRPLPTPRVEVTALQVVGADAGLPALARGLSADIAGFLNESGLQTTLNPLSAQPGSPRADLRFSGALSGDARQLSIRIFLEDPQSRLTLWTREFKGDRGDADRLREAAAAAAAESIYTALEPRQQKGLKLDPGTLALHIRGSEIVKSPQRLREGDARHTFEQVVARAPNFAGGHATLAVALANEARRATSAERAVLVARARREAQIAIGIDAYASGAAFDAIYMLNRLERPREIADAEEGLLKGLERAPEFPFLHMRECRLLTEVGRAREALPHCQRAQALRPMAGPIGHSLARTLYVAGDVELATQAAEAAARRSPDHGETRQVLFELAAFSGSPSYARRLLRDPASTPTFTSRAAHPALEAFLLARETGRPADVEAAVRELRTAGTDGRLALSVAARALAAMGHTDLVFELLNGPRFEGAAGAQATTFLLEPTMAAVRKDPRFWSIAARTGLASYWTTRGRWPDFCGREVPLPTCKTQANAALGEIAPYDSPRQPAPRA
jgi:DNA-binding winged helix-turn-helix (wHTH) protein/tetratricopeptide (TPR) repeat protein